MFKIARTKTGEAVHAVRETTYTRTLCGRAAVAIFSDQLITREGIQHPWRCERCSAAIARHYSAH